MDDCITGKAKRLMVAPLEHIFKGIDFYMEGGDFIREHHNKMFVGRIDNQQEDLKRLGLRLELQHVRLWTTHCWWLNMLN